MTTAATDWRSFYTLHPVAAVFPPLEKPELDALAADIKQHGLIRAECEATNRGGTKGLIRPTGSCPTGAPEGEPPFKVMSIRAS